ncbi:glycosyltransferase [Flavobacterium sp. LC2016-01]|uniref:glycosyltransferase n=1 Tax=Flavobacterium sp. LC2016-01 TaxID=2675876 RepID=UPI0012BB0526|nr:glycosyltransferase [Flavobacterium sp. LC2016-01]MTH17560.1 glycosyltransferase [Flavobacterium sp. LC2016-01]
MKLLVVTNAPIIYKTDKAFAYSPYVKELMVWEKYADIVFCCPVWKNDQGLLISEMPFNISKHYKLFDTNLKSFKEIVKAFFLSFCNFFMLLKAMNNADHIHLRCPGNIGLLGCIAQVFFPNKKKTAKYAGNWDPKSKQPLSYRLQKWILSNSFLTRNIQVLVYGDWKNQSRNIKPFFTATYSETEKEIVSKNNLNLKAEFIFVGSLVSGKNPLYVIKLVQELMKKGVKANLNLYGNGSEKNNLEIYIKENKLEDYIILHGNQNKETVKKAYQKSHFVILPSKSEGWPKAIAEGMFWGCVPIATKVSCVPFMLDYGNRGVLLEMNLEKDLHQLDCLFKNNEAFEFKSKLAQEWSQTYTTDFFENEIKNLL